MWFMVTDPTHWRYAQIGRLVNVTMEKGVAQYMLSFIPGQSSRFSVFEVEPVKSKNVPTKVWRTHFHD